MEKTKDINYKFLKSVNKDEVINKILTIMKSGVFHVFITDRCPECEKNNLNVHYGYYEKNACGYFICHSCGHKWRRFIVCVENGKIEIKHKQYFAKLFYNEKENKTFYGIPVNKTKAIIIDNGKFRTFNYDGYKALDIERREPYKKR